MAIPTLLDFFPLWAAAVLTFSIVVLATEVGFRLGNVKRKQKEHERDSSVSAMSGATLGLLAFLLAFTFDMAAGRFEVRKRLVVEEANAIGTAYLRADLVEESYGRAIKKLLKEYVDIRVNGSVQGSGTLQEVLNRSDKLHDEIWTEVRQLVRTSVPNPINNTLIEALNDVIDLHSTRIALALRNRIPGAIWSMLYLMSIIGMMSVGYQSGLAGHRSVIGSTLLGLGFTLVITLIIDLDRPQRGFLRVGQEPLLEVQEKIDANLSAKSNQE